MANKTHLWIEDTIEKDSETLAGATIESPTQERKFLWYRLVNEYGCALTKRADSFLLAAIFSAMRSRADLVVHGEVSAGLLRNLEEFQAVWNRWLPQKYSKIEISAEVEKERAKSTNSDWTIAAFSGGVDSCFTVWRHRNGKCGRLRRNLQAALMVHGFDIPTNEDGTFENAAGNARKMLDSLGIKLITMVTNFRDLGDDWEDAHGAAIASCLMLLEDYYEVGLVASTEPYNNLVLPWGSNPVTDGLMSSEVFQIVHDGAAFARNDKVREILNWPEALKYLRVCWQGEKKDRNCGCCEKCIRTILNFRVVGASLPECFGQDVSDSQILGLRGLNPVQTAYLEEILLAAKVIGIQESWVGALEKCVMQNCCAASGGGKFWQKLRRKAGVRRYLRRLVSSGQDLPRELTLVHSGVKG